MQGASRTGVRQLTASLAATAADDGVAGFAELADQLAGVVGVLADSGELRRALTDPATDTEAKAGLVRALFGQRVSSLTLQLLAEAAAQRWSQPGDLADALETLAQMARFHLAERDGVLDEVEDELYRLARIVAGSPALHEALSSLQVPAEQRLAVLRDLVGERVQPATLAVVEQIVVRPRGRRIEDALQQAAERATERHGELHAEVTAAIPLEPAQVQRLTAALGRLYGRPVRASVTVDPRVLGGVKVQVGDEMIDGTIAHRLEQARAELAE